MMTNKRTVRFSYLKELLPYLFLTAFFIISSDNINAQTAGKDEEIFIVADEMPSFPGGQKVLMETIYSKITYPEDAKEKGIQGKVTVRFVINKEGKPVQASISKGLCPSIDKEVLSVISKIPSFLPGKIAGKPVSVWYALPITFKLLNN